MKTAEKPRAERVPPQNLDAERGVIGSLWLAPSLCDDVALAVRAEDFYGDAHAKLFRRTLEMHNEGKHVDPTLLHERLKAAGELDSIGGLAYMLEITEAVPHAANAVYYARIVREKATLRRLVNAATEILRDASDEPENAQELLNRAEQLLFGVRDDRSTEAVNAIRDVLMDALEGIDRGDPSFRHGLTSGIRNLDTLTGGFRPGEVTILAGRPGNGKSALAGNIAEHLSLEKQKHVLFLSLEMSKLELGERLLCSHGGINSYKLKSGTLDAMDRRRLMEAFGRLGKATLAIDDTPNRSITEIAAICRRLRRQEKLDLLMIDYLQLVTPDNKKEPRQEQVAGMSRRLKHMAKELNIPILCLAQLNRQAETTGEPQLWHLRESGAIEQDADKVMFIWRTGERGDEAILKVAKNRNGTTGKVALIFNAEHVAFRERVDAAIENAKQQYEDYGLPNGDF